jgi:hypothetical protein
MLIKITDEAYEVPDVIEYNTDGRMHGPPNSTTIYNVCLKQGKKSYIKWGGTCLHHIFSLFKRQDGMRSEWKER